MVVRIVCNIRLRQQHQVVFHELHGPDGLGKSKSMAVLDILRSEVEPWGSGQPAPRRRWRHAELVATIEDR